MISSQKKKILDIAIAENEDRSLHVKAICADKALFNFEVTACKNVLNNSGSVEVNRNDKELNIKNPEFINVCYKAYKSKVAFEINKLVFDDELAKDLCQEVFIKAWKNKDSYDPARGQLYTWLINIARNHCKDYFKSRQGCFKRNSISLEFYTEGVLRSSTISSDKMEVHNLLKQLTSEKREIINLLFIEEFTQSEVAKLKNMPLGSIKTKSRSAIQQLRKLSNSK